MQVIKYLIVIFMAVLTLQVGAQVQQARGQYSVNYKEFLGTFDRKEVPRNIKQKAQQEATMKAVEAYYAEAGQSESANFNAIRAKILENPGRYVLDTTVISETDNGNDFQYTVVVRISLNVANLRNAVQSNSAIGQAAAGEKTPLSFVFVARQVESSKSYDDRVFKRQEGSVQQSASLQEKNAVKEKTSEGESIKSSQISTNGSSSRDVDASVNLSKKTTVTSETGGSTVQRASESTWRLLPSADLDQVFSGLFAQAGYDVVESGMIESGSFKLVDIRNDYKSGDDLQPKTLKAIAAGMKAAEIPFIALGTLDVGLPQKDPQTGLMRVSVTVNAKIWDVTKPIPRTRAAVGPVAYAGVGPSENEARVSALKSAASNAAQELSSRMAEKGMR